MTVTVALAEATSRLSPRRRTSISPARPDADSRLVNATLARVSAKITSFHWGALPRWIWLVIASTSNSSARPRTTTSAWRPTSSSTRARIRRARQAEKPRTLRTAT